MASGVVALVTAARNESAYVERTIESVLAQTRMPVKWVVVDDGSTDATSRIVGSYAASHSLIDLVSVPPGGERDFGSKARCIHRAVARVAHLDYTVLAVIDADACLPPEFCERVADALDADRRLGITGGVVWEERRGRFRPQHTSTRWSVSGTAQVFRRACWEDIGGYRALAGGGIDALAEVMARMHGWEVRALDDLRVDHLRPMGTANQHVLRARYRQGINDHAHGHHPLFVAARAVARLRERPRIVGGVARFLGFCGATVRRRRRVVDDDVVRFLRREQLSRLRSAVLRSPVDGRRSAVLAGWRAYGGRRS